MARVAAFEVPGVEMWLPSGDHEPAHFHARKAGHWDAKVYIQEPAENMIQLLRPPGARMRGSDRRAIVSGVLARRLELLEEWEACQTT